MLNVLGTIHPRFKLIFSLTALKSVDASVCSHSLNRVLQSMNVIQWWVNLGCEEGYECTCVCVCEVQCIFLSNIFHSLCILLWHFVYYIVDFSSFHLKITCHITNGTGTGENLYIHKHTWALSFTLIVSLVALQTQTQAHALYLMQSHFRQDLCAL